MIDVADAHFVPIGTAGGRLYLETDRDAPLGRVIAVDAMARAGHRGDRAGGRGRAGVRPDSSAIGWRPSYLHDAHNRLALFELDGRPAGEVALPGSA